MGLRRSLVIRGTWWRRDDLDPSRGQGAQLDRTGGRAGRDQLPLAVPDDESAVEAEVELDPSAGIAAPARARRQLEDGRATRTV